LRACVVLETAVNTVEYTGDRKSGLLHAFGRQRSTRGICCARTTSLRQVCDLECELTADSRGAGGGGRSGAQGRHRPPSAASHRAARAPVRVGDSTRARCSRGRSKGTRLSLHIPRAATGEPLAPTCREPPGPHKSASLVDPTRCRARPDDQSTCSGAPKPGQCKQGDGSADAVDMGPGSGAIPLAQAALPLPPPSPQPTRACLLTLMAA
jgi:hypothetical protein